uniref:Tetraspanin-9 n=1 Tax=Oryzias sinensis TaxID=183150 RepID=A0A8C7XTR1_9TELE
SCRAAALSSAREFKKCNMARGCLCCLKYLMFAFNLIFWLCGCGLLGVGIWLSVSQGSFATFSPSFPSLSAANMVIAIGAIVMVTGFLGCLGAIKENKCLLLSFFIVLLVILLAELILLILFFVYSDKVRMNAKQDLKDGLALYNSENNLGLRNAWNIIQAEWKCCGVNAYSDWYEALQEKVVPDRCCQEHYQNCGRNTTSMFWERGCFEKVEEWLDNNKHVLGTIGTVILVVQVRFKNIPLETSEASEAFCAPTPSDISCEIQSHLLYLLDSGKESPAWEERKDAAYRPADKASQP